MAREANYGQARAPLGCSAAATQGVYNCQLFYCIDFLFLFIFIQGIKCKLINRQMYRLARYIFIFFNQLQKKDEFLSKPVEVHGWTYRPPRMPRRTVFYPPPSTNIRL